MATSENSINNELLDLNTRLQSVSAQMHYAVDTLRVFSLCEDDMGFMPGALTMMAETLTRVRDDVDDILSKAGDLGRTANHISA